MLKGDLLKKLLTELLDYYQELLVSTRNQADLIKTDAWEELSKLLAAREEIIEKIDQLMVRIEPLKEELVAGYHLNEQEWLRDLKEKQALSPALESVITSLYQVRADNQAIDRENRERLAQTRRVLHQEMTKLQTGIRVNKKYNKNNRIYSSFFDKRS